jgi:hypothetical protein
MAILLGYDDWVMSITQFLLWTSCTHSRGTSVEPIQEAINGTPDLDVLRSWPWFGAAKIPFDPAQVRAEEKSGWMLVKRDASGCSPIEYATSQ